MSPQGGHYPNYRKIIEELPNTSVIPYQPLILSDLTRIEEFPTYREESVINWAKMESLSTVFSTLLRFRNLQNYKIKEDASITSYLETAPILSEDELLLASTSFEPEKKK